ncbi:MAG TPA: cytochrome c biogenesis protein CcsA [Chiayiivirga sp.]|nr:cytochrome c biogenesis protein CcsA [Chiayiivirga sp.]
MGLQPTAVLCDTLEMIPSLVSAACVLYLLATAWQLRALTAHGAHAGIAPSLMALAAALLHGLAIGFLWRLAGGIDLHFSAALAVVAIVVAALTASLSLRRPIGALGIISYPCSAAFLVAYWLSQTGTPSPSTLAWPIQLHAGLSLLAYAALSLAALLAIALWLQERALRQRHFGFWLNMLPPLTLVESLLFQLILAGFVLLAAALITGALFVDDLFVQHLVHKTVLSILAWLVFGALLLGRWRRGWRGRRAVRWTLSAMALLALAFFGSKFVLELVLARSG